MQFQAPINLGRQLMQDSGSAVRLYPLVSRIQTKRRNGEKLSAVEAHLHSSLPAIRHLLFGPSTVSVFADILKVFLRPIPILVILTLIIATERTSTALLPSTANDYAALDLLSIEDDFASDDELLPVSANTDLPGVTGIKQREGLIDFISGLISAYYPSIENAGSIARQIVFISCEEGLDPLFVASVVSAESSFKTHARSSIGALGLMQLRPSTALDVGKRRGARHSAFKLTDPKVNLRLGVAYLKELEQRYQGNRYLALAAYNWGPTRVTHARQQNRTIPRSVRHYSTKILEKTLRWHKNFQQATEDKLSS